MLWRTGEIGDGEIAAAMKTSDAGRKAIIDHEGVRLNAYRDPVGVLTIGAGHTSAAGPPEVVPGMTITLQEAHEILARDLEAVERDVERLVTVPLNQHEFDALVSFVYNLGVGNFRSSTLLRKLNAGDRQGAANEFARWDKAGGRVLPGLTKRRAAERLMFLRSPPERPDLPSAYPPRPILRRGASGPAVRELQAALNRAGANPLLVEDGDFGPATMAAVKALQTVMGLAVDGVVGPQTYRALGLQ